MKGVNFYSFCYYHYYIVCLMLISLACGTIAEDSYDQDGGIIGVPIQQPINQITTTITVDSHGSGHYMRIQQAIDSIPFGNQKWIRILIKVGIYREKITIPMGKGYIYMQGEGIQKTVIYYKDHQSIDTSATLTALSDNIIISGITIKNTYNIRSAPETQIIPAPAAKLAGDKYLIIDSSFDGVQDTLYDCKGRHYYRRCVISGGIDFIFGYAQSIFEECTLKLDVANLATGRVYGTITAQGRNSPRDYGGFVFKYCTITGKGKALLGRAWGAYARVIFYHSTFSDSILPIGWDAWKGKGQEGHLTFVEDGCTGVGADTSKRVPWLRKGSDKEILKLIDLSYINHDGWINRLPIKFIV